jgi:hypothetical protein
VHGQVGYWPVDASVAHAFTVGVGECGPQELGGYRAGDAVMTRTRWIAAVAALLALDLYLLVWRTAEVMGNCEAQVIIVTPAFVISHLLHRRDANRHHDEQVRRAEAQAAELAAHRREMAAVAEKVRELHDFHIGFKLPDRELRPPTP